MKRDLNKIKSSHYELLIAGGGINGAAMAHMAASCGIKTLLLDKGDFAGGTSSKSSKLLHGGIRYLEQFHFGLVRESLRERYWHQKEIPRLAKPVRFIIPVYDGDKRPLWMMRLGVWLYDQLAGPYAIEKHERLSAAETARLLPGIESKGLLGSVTYWDVQMEDARLCLEHVLAAAEKGADTANYVRVMSFMRRDKKACGVMVRDELLPESPPFEIYADRIICAGGPWTNQLLRADNFSARKMIRMTKGTHVVYEDELCRDALLLTARKDNRVFFVIPWKGRTLIGTTDTSYASSPDEVEPSERDINYLLEETRRVFPERLLTREKIVNAFAGLRPLIRRWGSPSAVSREHKITRTDSGIVVVAGGKFTTYRVMAEETLQYAGLEKFTANRKKIKLFESVPELSAAEAGDENTVFLREKYGHRYSRVLDLMRQRPELKEKIWPGLPYIKAQIEYARREEMAQNADDIIYRRLGVGWTERNLRLPD